MALRHATSFLIGLLAVACFVAGCGHPVRAKVQFEDDACGVPVYVGVRVTTEAGAPVSDAEVWRVFEPNLTPAAPNGRDCGAPLTVPASWSRQSVTRAPTKHPIGQ